MPKIKKTFLYDKENHLTGFFETSDKDGVLSCYFLKNNQLIKANRFKDKKIWHTKKTAIQFDEPVKLTYFDIEGYGFRISVSKRYLDRIEPAKIHSRIENVDKNTFNNFTIKSGLINSWVSKL